MMMILDSQHLYKSPFSPTHRLTHSPKHTDTPTNFTINHDVMWSRSENAKPIYGILRISICRLCLSCLIISECVCSNVADGMRIPQGKFRLALKNIHHSVILSSRPYGHTCTHGPYVIPGHIYRSFGLVSFNSSAYVFFSFYLCLLSFFVYFLFLSRIYPFIFLFY